MTKLAQVSRTGSRPWDRSGGRSRRNQKLEQQQFKAGAGRNGISVNDARVARRAAPGEARASAADSPLSPSRPLPNVAITIEQSRHTPSPLLTASIRPRERNLRHFYHPNDTPHTLSRCLPISGECRPQDNLGGSGGRLARLCDVYSARGSCHSTEDVFLVDPVLTILCSSPVYAVSATPKYPSHCCCLELLTGGDATENRL